MRWGRALGLTPRAGAGAGAAARDGIPAIPGSKGLAHDLEQRPGGLAAVTDGLSPIGFLDVHGEIDREGGGLTPL